MREKSGMWVRVKEREYAKGQYTVMKHKHCVVTESRRGMRECRPCERVGSANASVLVLRV